MFEKEMIKRGIKNYFELTEFDTWVNEIEREVINKLLKEYENKLFGLVLWEFKFLESFELKNVLNFGVNYIFKLKDKEKVLNLIKEYQDKKIKDIDFLNQLSDLAVYIPLWV
jgi:hypothetical protein